MAPSTRSCSRVSCTSRCFNQLLLFYLVTQPHLIQPILCCWLVNMSIFQKPVVFPCEQHTAKMLPGKVLCAQFQNCWTAHSPAVIQANLPYPLIRIYLVKSELEALSPFSGQYRKGRMGSLSPSLTPSIQTPHLTDKLFRQLFPKPLQICLAKPRKCKYKLSSSSPFATQSGKLYAQS